MSNKTERLIKNFKDLVVDQNIIDAGENCIQLGDGQKLYLTKKEVRHMVGDW